MDSNNPGIFNQAIMDIGSILCTPTNTKCDLCPVKNSCFSIENGTIYKLPVIKKTKKSIKHRFFYYIIIYDHHNNICINKRLKNDIWKGLYDFPLIESKNNLTISEIIGEIWNKFRIIVLNSMISFTMKYKLTHQILSIQFLNCKILQNSKNILLNNFFFISSNKIGKYPFPRPITLFFKHKKMI
ncbi:NUDIX domain-containing protein [Blattabacterium cuenoti]|uniref:NUDIX domain-containing protein n=1 Tax=Blattabacterium cuenoti TaxID=1653831 RepID=UPI001EECA0D3|nr:NUDIX domain-containing protein [Blattabacterium cuenoti]